MRFLQIILIGLFSQVIYAGEMVKVPVGKFKPFLKESATLSSESVKVSPFYLDVYPVTKKDYKEFIQKYPKWSPGKPSSLYVDNGYLQDWKKEKNQYTVEENTPVTFVSWFSAKAYCESQGKRLPTEVEWEYAAGFPPDGGTSKDVENKIMDWFGEKKPDRVPEVGQYKNRLGIYDLHGLIWEWVYDFNNSSVTGDSRQDSDLESSLFCGGGSLKANDFSNYAAYMRYGHRAGLKGWYTGKYLGFRCASDHKLP